MFLLIFLFIVFGFLGFFVYLSIKYQNPYKLTFIFGKKGAGKSCYMVKLMLRFIRKDWIVYTDMEDINIVGVRIISVSDLSTFKPVPHSVLFLDEVGISMDNRSYKSFPPGLRDFFKYARKMKVRIYMNSQAYDVDKKVRDTTDGMCLQSCIFGCIGITRPIIRTVTLVESTAQADSRIADNLKFGHFWSWRITYMPRYFKYFNSLEMPARDDVDYDEVTDGIIVTRRSLREAFSNVFRKVQTWGDL